MAHDSNMTGNTTIHPERVKFHAALARYAAIEIAAEAASAAVYALSQLRQQYIEDRQRLDARVQELRSGKWAVNSPSIRSELALLASQQLDFGVLLSALEDAVARARERSGPFQRQRDAARPVLEKLRKNADDVEHRELLDAARATRMETRSTV